MISHKFYIFIWTVFLFQTISFAQVPYGLLRPKDPLNGAECKSCNAIFRAKPKEVHFSIKKNDNDNLFFEITDKAWLSEIFKNPKDGFLVDIVSKNKYNCSLGALDSPNSLMQGTSLKPVFSKQIKTKIVAQKNGRFTLKLGVVPESLRGQELEFNIFFINNNYLCRYYKIYNLKAYDLELLDMGMYLDTITYQSDLNKKNPKDGFRVKYKKLQFKIPFERNKSEYFKEDIKPVYDSLNLTSFNIKKINIKAYSSVEGSLERNLELQSQRAKSIVNALQQFQTPVIETTISTSENWVEFLNDIENTEYALLASLKKEEIRNKLRNSEIRNGLEKYLQNHRKAIIILDLEKKDQYKKIDSEELFKLFNENISGSNIEEANTIQNVIFERMKQGQISPDRIIDLNVPKQKQHVDFINKNNGLKFLYNVRKGMIVYNDLLRLEQFKPDDKKIKYNLCALKFTIWRNKWQPIDTAQFKQQILALKKYGIKQVLIDRMLINYEILKAESYLSKGDYGNKDKSTAYIFDNYKDKVLRDEDLLNLANYFSRFSNNNYSKELLKNRVQSIEVSEDLLFYYLNLTLIDQELTTQNEYRAMMQNAYAKNPERFCKLFNSFNDGGITFQLLENPYLRNSYCESCN